MTVRGKSLIACAAIASLSGLIGLAVVRDDGSSPTNGQTRESPPCALAPSDWLPIWPIPDPDPGKTPVIRSLREESADPLLYMGRFEKPGHFAPAERVGFPEAGLGDTAVDE